MSSTYVQHNPTDCDPERNWWVNEIHKSLGLTGSWLPKRVAFTFLPKLWFQTSTNLKFHIVSPLQVFLVVSGRACYSHMTDWSVYFGNRLTLSWETHSLWIGKKVQHSNYKLRLCVQTAWTGILTLPLSSHMTLGKLLHLCMLQFPDL